MATYRAIVLFEAASDASAKQKAEAGAKASGGKLDRLTVQRTTWGPVEEPQPAAANA